jgi:hypothetical protein
MESSVGEDSTVIVGRAKFLSGDEAVQRESSKEPPAISDRKWSVGSWLSTRPKNIFASTQRQARLAQSVERTALNRVVVGSSPTVGVLLFLLLRSLFACLSNRPRHL